VQTQIELQVCLDIPQAVSFLNLLFFLSYFNPILHQLKVQPNKDNGVHCLFLPGLKPKMVWSLSYMLLYTTQESAKLKQTGVPFSIA
jgi:hypothetical protein